MKILTYDKIIKKFSGNYEKFLKTSNKQYLDNIMKYFYLPINSNNNADDYGVLLDEILMEITILDKKNRIEYIVRLESSSSLLERSSDYTRFIDVTTNYLNLDIRKSEVFDIYDENKNPLVEQISILYDNKKIILNRERNHDFRYGNKFQRDKFNVKYSRIISDLDKGIITKPCEESLFTNYIFYYPDSDYTNTIEQCYNYNFKGGDFIDAKDKKDKCFYIDSSNLIYRVEERKYNNSEINGILFEKSLNKDDRLCYLPIKSWNYFAFHGLATKIRNPLSEIIFIYEQVDKEANHTVQIVKTEKDFVVSYVKLKREFIGQEIEKNEWIKTENNLTIPVLNNGPITTNEIDYLILSLNDIIPDIIDVFSNELTIFKKRIALRNGETVIREPLSPRLLSGLTSNELVEYLSKNKEELFVFAEQRFQNSTNLNEKYQKRLFF